MTRNQAWARAYREQAAADLAALHFLANDPAVPGSVIAMLLQMVVEKAMKSALLAFDSQSTPEIVASGHRAFERVLRTAALNRDAPLGRMLLPARWRAKTQPNNDPLFAFLKSLDAASPSAVSRRDHAEGIDRLSLPCLEYPWENSGRKSCHWPEQRHEIALSIKDPVNSPLKRALHYLERVVKDLDSTIPRETTWG